MKLGYLISGLLIFTLTNTSDADFRNVEEFNREVARITGAAKDTRSQRKEYWALREKAHKLDGENQELSQKCDAARSRSKMVDLEVGYISTVDDLDKKVQGHEEAISANLEKIAELKAKQRDSLRRRYGKDGGYQNTQIDQQIQKLQYENNNHRRKIKSLNKKLAWYEPKLKEILNINNEFYNNQITNFTKEKEALGNCVQRKTASTDGRNGSGSQISALRW